MTTTTTTTVTTTKTTSCPKRYRRGVFALFEIPQNTHTTHVERDLYHEDAIQRCEEERRRQSEVAIRFNAIARERGDNEVMEVLDREEQRRLRKRRRKYPVYDEWGEFIGCRVW